MFGRIQGYFRARPARRPLTIAILSFNRPDYLRQVLASLAPQLQPDDDVLLFQDGAQDRFTGALLTAPEAVAACLAVFDGFCPPGACRRATFPSHANLGIARNYRRAEAHVFETLRRDGALFLEDDLVLGPHYLRSISQLLAIAGQEPRIGYVAAYGDFWASIPQQRARAAELLPMHENWGAALTRRSWLAQKPIRERYWELIAHGNYAARDHQMIRAFYRDLGFNLDITSQDGARWIACCVAGLARLTPAVCQARYIGASGVHCTPEYYALHRFAEAEIYPDMPQIRRPGGAALERWIEQSRASFRQGYVHPYAQPRAARTA